MYSEKENFLKTIYGENPDRLCAGYDALGVVRLDPLSDLDRGRRVEGQSLIDVFGTEIVWPKGQPAAMPHVTDENKVIKDIENWRNEVTLPDFLSMDLDWTENAEACAQVNRDEKLLTTIMATGLFERLHFLMGFEDTFINMLTNPDEVHELLDALLDVRMAYAKLIIDNMQPEVIVHHDDWGNKTSLFMQPDTWREFFKERYRKLYGYMRERGVIVIHHADCYLAPIVEDMAEIGVQVWQGAIPENDIPTLLKRLDGSMTIMGGIDVKIDHEDWTEQEVHDEVYRACKECGLDGYFIPCLTYGGPPSIYPGVKEAISEEVHRYNKEVYGIG